jgi:hypothetical protein
LLTGKYNDGIEATGRLGNPNDFKDNAFFKRFLERYFGSEEGNFMGINILKAKIQH